MMDCKRALAESGGDLLQQLSHRQLLRAAERDRLAVEAILLHRLDQAGDQVLHPERLEADAAAQDRYHG